MVTLPGQDFQQFIYNLQENGMGMLDPNGNQMILPGESYTWNSGMGAPMVFTNPTDKPMPLNMPQPVSYNVTPQGTVPAGPSPVQTAPTNPSPPPSQGSPFPPSSSWLSMLMGMMPPRPAPPRPISSIFDPASFAPQASAYTPTFPSMGVQPDLMGSQVKIDGGINDITSKAMSSTDSLTKMAGQSGYGGTMQARPAQSSFPSFSLGSPSVSMPVSAYPSTMLSPLSSIDRGRTGK